jgi:hypothetical protein
VHGPRTWLEAAKGWLLASKVQEEEHGEGGVFSLFDGFQSTDSGLHNKAHALRHLTGLEPRPGNSSVAVVGLQPQLAPLLPGMSQTMSSIVSSGPKMSLRTPWMS